MSEQNEKKQLISLLVSDLHTDFFFLKDICAKMLKEKKMYMC